MIKNRYKIETLLAGGEREAETDYLIMSKDTGVETQRHNLLDSILV